MIFKVHGPRKIAIAGLGGIGKTQIALELAYRVRDRDSQYSVFWVPCTSIATVEQAYMSIAQMLGVHGTSPSETKERLKLYLSQPSAGKWLLIFDNADESDMWLPGPGPRELIPQSEHGRVIFTSRNQKLAVTLASPHIVQLSGLDERTAMHILNESLVQKELLNDRKATVDLLSQLAFLPLAIVQAANYINENNISLGDYLELLQEHESEVVTLLSESFGDDWRYQDMQNPVATTWLISFQQIQRMDPLAAEYLSVMGCLHPRDIPQSLLPAAPSKKRELEAIGLLKAYSFISVSGRSDDACFNLHRLVYLAIRNWLRLNQQMEPYIFRTAGILAERFPTYAAANRPLWRQYLPHALSLIGEKDFREKRQLYLLLLQNIGKCLLSDGRFNEADAIFYDIMTISTDLWGAEHPFTIVMMDWVSYVYQFQQRTSEAEQLQMRSFETLQRKLGLEHLETINRLVALSITYYLQGRLSEAEKMQKQVLDRYTQVLGPTDFGTLFCMERLGRIYESQGRWKEAAALAKEVLTARRRALPPDSSGISEAMQNLAAVYYYQDRLRRAEKLMIRALEAKQHIMGDEHPDTMYCMGRLATIYLDQGRTKKAEELTIKVVEANKRQLGPRHPLTLCSLDKLGVCYSRQKRLAEAEKVQVEVMELRKKFQGPEDPETLNSMEAVAWTWKLLFRRDDAVALMTECVRLRRQVFGPDHPATRYSVYLLRRCEAQRRVYLRFVGVPIVSRFLKPEAPRYEATRFSGVYHSNALFSSLRTAVLQ
jgi:tetratricopeptide (TPR) repeat protein